MKRKDAAHLKEALVFLERHRNGRGIRMTFEADLVLQELATCLDVEQSVVLGAFGDLQGEGPDAGRFEELVNQRVEAQRQAGSAKEWTLYVPFELTLDYSPTAPYTPLGESLQFVSSAVVRDAVMPALDLPDEELPGVVKVDKHGRALRRIHSVEIDRALLDAEGATFAVMSGRGPNLSAAFGRQEAAFTLFRGMLEWTFNQGAWKKRFPVPVGPRSIVPEPHWMLGVSEEGDVSRGHFRTIEPTQKRRPAFKGGHDIRLRWLISELPRDKTGRGIESLVQDALRLYAKALDEPLPSGNLLGLWRVAETLASTQEGSTGRGGDVVSRLGWLGKQDGLPGTGWYHTLDAIRRKRNRFVHHGEGQVDDDEINYLKWICERTVGWIMSNRDTLKTEAHLREFYSLREQNDRKLEAVLDVAEFVRTSRHKGG